MDGDVEFNYDDEDAVNSTVITRRLNLTTNAVGNFQSSLASASQMDQIRASAQRKKVFGHEARMIYLKCFQHILRLQTRALIEDHQFPRSFETTIKIIWVKLLSKMSKNEPQLLTEDVLEYGEGEIETDNMNHFVNPTTEKDTNKVKNNEQNHGFNIVTSLAILCIGTVHLRLPVYVSDYMSWICSKELPYFNVKEVLPKIWLNVLPNYYIALLNGYRTPSNGQIYKKIAFVGSMIDIDLTLNIAMPYEGLLLRLVLRFALPPDFYQYAMEVMQLLPKEMAGTKLCLLNSRDFKSYHLVPELKTVSIFIIAFKWLLIVDNNEEQPLYDTHWVTNLIEYLKNDKYSVNKSKYTTQKFIASVSYDTRDPSRQNQVLGWNPDQITTYLNWIEEEMSIKGSSVPERFIDQRIAQKKLHKIFTLESNIYPKDSKASQRTMKYSDELLENYIKVNNRSFNHQISERTEIMDQIKQLVDLLSANLASEFAISQYQLSQCLTTIERHLTHHAKKLHMHQFT